MVNIGGAFVPLLLGLSHPSSEIATKKVITRSRYWVLGSLGTIRFMFQRLRYQRPCIPTTNKLQLYRPRRVSSLW